MKIWYKNLYDTKATFFSLGSSVRPDELFFESDVPIDWRVSTYSIEWSGDVPTLVRDADADDIINIESKTKAFDDVMSAIDEKNRFENLKNFTYDGNTYISDKDSIEAVQNQCLIMQDTDTIPVPNGVWKSADVQYDGFTPVYVPMTVADFKLFATAFFMIVSSNFSIKEFHKNNVKALYADVTKTADDIVSYDFTTGWY